MVQKKTINKIIKDNYRKAISIQFSLDGFSFCISNVITKEVQNFSVYNFDKLITTPELLLAKIEEIFNDTILLKQEFETVTVIHQNSLSTLVPTALFDENQLHLYLDYNIKTLTNDYLAFDSLNQSDSKNIYVPYVNINNYFFQQFGEFEYKHHSTILIDKLILYSKNNLEKQCFINVSGSDFDIIVVENSKLLFYNSFSFNTKKDFIYYILFTAEQLKLNPEEFLLYFIGEIEKESELYKITYQYVRNVDFIKLENSIFEQNTDFSSHSHYITLP